jgi:hypothetical protein
MEGYCSTGQSPQQTAVRVEEEEEEAEEEEEEEGDEFWDNTPFGLVKVYHRFRRFCCLRNQDCLH